MPVLLQSLHNLQGFPIKSISDYNPHLHPHIDYDDQQVAERSEEKRCEAEARAEKPRRGDKEKKSPQKTLGAVAIFRQSDGSSW